MVKPQENKTFSEKCAYIARIVGNVGEKITREQARDLIAAALNTGSEHEAPVSVLLVGKPATGKTHQIKHFQNRGYKIEFLSEATKAGLKELLLRTQDFSHVMMPDLSLTLSGKSSAEFAAVMNPFLDEGADKLYTKNYQIDAKGKRFGLITACTERTFSQRMQTLEENGFLTRIVIVRLTGKPLRWRDLEKKAPFKKTDYRKVELTTRQKDELEKQLLTFAFGAEYYPRRYAIARRLLEIW